MAVKMVGLLGLGLLGRSIASCLLGHGLKVIAFDRRGEETYDQARTQIQRQLRELVDLADFSTDIIESGPAHFSCSQQLDEMTTCDFFIESIEENVQAKQQLFDQLEIHVDPAAPIASNTSALPISILQESRQHPDRFIGMHWSQPAHNTRFMEIIAGTLTSKQTVDTATQLARQCGKDPSVLKKDIRGFITNRLMYALFREAIHLLESGVADAATIDRSFRNDVGWYATLAGPFRHMDLTGLPAYAKVMEDLFAELSTQKELPDIMKQLIDQDANGVFNGKGFYDYTPEESKHWQKMWEDFSWDARRLADKYTPLK